MKRVLFLCTGNSCRSQMADGIVNHDFAGRIEAFSAGTEPHGLNPRAVRIMNEIGIDIGGNSSDHIGEYEGQRFDYIITLCGDADGKCPTFFGGVKRLHPVRKRKSWPSTAGFGMRFDGNWTGFSPPNCRETKSAWNTVSPKNFLSSTAT